MANKNNIFKRIGLFFKKIAERRTAKPVKQPKPEKKARKWSIFRRVRQSKPEAVEYEPLDEITLTSAEIDIIQKDLEKLSKLADTGEVITIPLPKSATTTREVNKVIRYHILRDAGYSSKEAGRLRSTNFIPIEEVNRVKLQGNQVIKSEYDKVTDLYSQNNQVAYFRSIKDTGVFSRHGYLSNPQLNNDKELSTQYVNYVFSLMKRYQINEQQAWIMAYYQVEDDQRNPDEIVRELMTNANFEMSKSPIKKRRSGR